MPYTNHSKRTETLGQVIDRHEDGTLLKGEADMHERITHDCEASKQHWHLWYYLSLNIQYTGLSEIQIDFSLIYDETSNNHLLRVLKYGFQKSVTNI